MPFEFAILNFIQTHLRSGVGDAVMPLLTTLGNSGLVWLALGLVLCCFRATRKYGVTVLTALLFMLITCNGLLKPLVARTRPCDINTAIQLLIAHPADYSFPSGHTAAGFAATAALAFAHCRQWGVAAVLAGFIAFSRLYLYVHFPTDVLAGVALGILCGWLAVKTLTYIETLFSERA